MGSELDLNLNLIDQDQTTKGAHISLAGLLHVLCFKSSKHSYLFYTVVRLVL